VQGQCIHHSELGNDAPSLVTLKSGGRDHLVVQLLDRLVIFP
jgi:hypothetical protein